MSNKTELEHIYRKLVKIFTAYNEHDFSFDATAPDHPEEQAKKDARSILDVIEGRRKKFIYVTRENQDHAQSAEQYEELFEVTKLMSDSVFQLLDSYSINWINFKERVSANGLYHNGFMITQQKKRYDQNEIERLHDGLTSIFRSYYDKNFGFPAMDHQFDSEGMAQEVINVIERKRDHVHFNARENEGDAEYQTQKYYDILNNAFQKFANALEQFLNRYAPEVSFEETSKNYEITISTV